MRAADADLDFSQEGQMANVSFRDYGWIGGVYQDEIDGPWAVCITMKQDDGTWRAPVQGTFDTARKAADALIAGFEQNPWRI